MESKIGDADFERRDVGTTAVAAKMTRQGEHADPPDDEEPHARAWLGIGPQQAEVEGKDIPLVSVVVPTHNRSALLARALRSVLRQIYANLEIIVVDDMSTDETRQVVECFRDSRIKYIRHDGNRGGAAARNTGIRAAGGEFVAFLDDDDEWREDKIERQLQALGAWDGIVCGSTSRASRRRRLPEGPIKREVLRRGYFLEGGSSALLVRADALRADLFDESLSRWQDWDLLIRLTQRWTIGYMDEPLVLYNEGSHPRITNRCETMSFTEVESRLIVARKHSAFFGSHWTKRHLARGLLAYIRQRDDKLGHVVQTVRATSLLCVILTFLERATGRMRREQKVWE